MKRDVTGGAVVMATMAALRDVGCPVRVVGLVAAAENAIGGNALRPGDVLRHYGGRTSEVTNTDAEGRLVPADAIAYAVAELGPDVVVDVATPTGAIRWRSASRSVGSSPTVTPRVGALGGVGDGGRAAVAVPAHRLLRAISCPPRSPMPTTPRWPRRDHGGAVPPALRRRRAWAHLDIASVGDAPRTIRVDHRTDRLQAVPCWSGSLRRTSGRDLVMHGLTVRWSLRRRPAGVGDELATYVADTSWGGSPAGRAALQDLADAPGRGFEGCYVFASDEARAEFQRAFAETAAESPGRRSSGPRRC